MKVFKKSITCLIWIVSLSSINLIATDKNYSLVKTEKNKIRHEKEIEKEDERKFKDDFIQIDYFNKQNFLELERIVTTNISYLSKTIAAYDRALFDKPLESNLRSQWSIIMAMKPALIDLKAKEISKINLLKLILNKAYSADLNENINKLQKLYEA